MNSNECEYEKRGSLLLDKTLLAASIVDKLHTEVFEIT
jgi:hypothetical protein